MAKTALLVGGTGPTGPAIAHGLASRGFTVTIAHRGEHELPEVAKFEHLHGDVFSESDFLRMTAGRTFDVTVATYGRLRCIAKVMQGRTGHFISVGGVPVYRGFFDASRFVPAGLPIPTREDAPLATEADDGKSYRVSRSEEILFELHPLATHFRYPFVYGPRQLAPREWCVVRRILDGRSTIVLPDGGLTLVPFGYVDNLAHALLLAIDQPAAAKGEIFNCGDDEKLTIAQVVQLVARELDHELEIISMPAELAVPARPLMMGHMSTHRVVDTSKLRDRLGYRDLVPARSAVAKTARWLVENPPRRGGYEEFALQDPFDYVAEDALISWWRNVLSHAPVLPYEELPGYGKAYAGPGTRVVRADTRI